MKVNKLFEQIFNVFANPKIYIIVAMISVILLFYNIWQIKPVVVNIEDFLGLTSHLTISYWLGLCLITFFAIKMFLDVKMKNSFIHILYLIILGLFLFSVPVFAEENARFPWTYYPAGEVKNVIETGYINTTSNYPIMSYHSWTATHFISASILFMSNIKIENLLKYMPVFWIFCVIFTVYSIGYRFKLPNNKSFLAVIFLISSFWSFHYYYGPQSLSYLMYLSVFLIMISFSGRFEYLLISLLTISTLIQTHLLTSIAILYSLIVSSKSLLGKHRFRFLVLILFIFAIWYIYVSPMMFNIGIKEIGNQVTNIKMFSFFDSGKYDEGTLLTRQIIHYTRLSYLITYVMLMIAFVILYLSGKIENKNNRLIKICSLWMIGILGLFMFRYGPEMDDRIYILSLLPMTMIIISLFSNKIIISIMLIFILLHIPAHYGTESFDMTLNTELKGAKFFAVKTNNVDSFFYRFPYVQYYDENKLYSKQYSNSVQSKINISDLSNSEYVLVSKQNNNFIIYSHEINPIQKWIINNKFYLIYDNSEYFKILKNI